jgi:predicted dehydrogenase
VGVRLPPSRVPDPADAPSLRWGILAPGGIARTFVDALQAHTGQRVVAVGSRSAARAAAFASEFGVARSYGSYEQLVADPEVDIVYVASPQSEHLAHGLLAVEAGKPVLVEKPFALSAAEAEQLVAAASARGVFLMEAMWTRFLPHIDVIRQVLDSSLLGEVHTLIADHGQAFDPAQPHRLFSPELGGGALLDLGVYPVSFASFALGAFASIHAVATPAPTGVDGQVSVIVTTPSGAHGLLNTTVLARTPTTACICGTRARLELEDSFYMPTTVRLIDAADGQVLDVVEPTFQRHRGLAFEAAAVARCVTDGRTESDEMPLEETLSVMRALDAIRTQTARA